MNPRLPFSLVIYVGSYLPLSLILFAQDFQLEKFNGEFCWPLTVEAPSCKLSLDNPHFSISTLVICLVCFILTILLLHSRKPNVPITVVASSHRPTELMNYTLPYVISFMGISYSSLDQFVGFSIFISWIFLISHRSGQTILNPVLIIFNWKLYEIEYSFPGDNKKFKGIALSKSVIEPAQQLKKLDFQKVLIVEPIPIDGDLNA